MAVDILSTKVPEIMSTKCVVSAKCWWRWVKERFRTVFTPDVNKYFQKWSWVNIIHYNLKLTTKHVTLKESIIIYKNTFGKPGKAVRGGFTSGLLNNYERSGTSPRLYTSKQDKTKKSLKCSRHTLTTMPELTRWEKCIDWQPHQRDTPNEPLVENQLFFF